MIFGADVAVQPAQLALAALAKEVGGQVQIAALARLAVELDQRSLDFGMTGRALSLAGPEDDVDVVGEALRHVQQPRVAGGAVKGDRGLHQMPGAVELVAVVQVRPAALRLHDLPVGVQIAVGLLRGLDQVDGRCPPSAASSASGSVASA